MNPFYKMYIQIGEDGATKTPVNPIYKDDLAIDYELETEQRFYRAKLSGKLTFVRKDYDLIMNASFDAVYNFFIEKSNDYGLTFEPYYTGKFMRTDCTINEYDKNITVQPTTTDEYNDVLAGLEKEYDLITLAPKINRVNIDKRPLIQMYMPGDSVVSCFLSGMTWEQDVNEAVSDVRILRNDYHFALCNLLKRIKITSTGTPNVSGDYTGRLAVSGTTDLFVGDLHPSETNGYYIHIEQELRYRQYSDIWTVTLSLRRIDGNVEMYRYSALEDSFINKEWELTPVGALGTANAKMNTYRVYARYLVDVEQIRELTTYQISTDDIVANNRNYRYVIGYAINVAYISNRLLDEPTEYGKADNGKYFAPPISFFGDKFYPIARSVWNVNNDSLWFRFSDFDWVMEKDARKTFVMRDCYPVSSVINVLLHEIAPGITHEATQEYSQFLYGQNPIKYQDFSLLVTPKSNLLVGEYQTPAQKAPTTLRQFLDMLKNCFQLYWHIENGKFIIEHVSFYKNGGSYTDSPVIGYDLTQLENVRNGKKWAFDTSEYTYDKEQMPERYEFEWMDDVTDLFKGQPIEIKSPYVQPGKIEQINISNFTPDVDYMLLNPGAISQDGFVLFGAILSNPRIYFEGSATGTNGDTSPNFDLPPGLVGIATLRVKATGGGRVSVYFWIGDKKVFTTGGFEADGVETIVFVSVPEGATALGFGVIGTVTVTPYELNVNMGIYSLPYVVKYINNVEYRLQNGYLAMTYLQPNYWLYDLPARNIVLNGQSTVARGIMRLKKQTLSFPVGGDDPNPLQLVKTHIGNGQIDKLSINLSSRTSKTTLKYDTE